MLNIENMKLLKESKSDLNDQSSRRCVSRWHRLAPVIKLSRISNISQTSLLSSPMSSPCSIQHLESRDRALFCAAPTPSPCHNEALFILHRKKRHVSLLCGTNTLQHLRSHRYYIPIYICLFVYLYGPASYVTPITP